MLKKLFVQNFALIEKATLELNNGFTVLTGETGSGKSILLGALRLILGERADHSVIRSKDDKTIVEAEFDMTYTDMRQWFLSNELDFFADTIVRREINSSGKSRAFINDTPVSLQLLKELSGNLIHIHSQHHTIDLKSPSFQLDLLDTLSDTLDERNEYEKKFTLYKQLAQKIKEAEEQKAKNALEIDFIRFQLEEFDKLNLDSINYEQLEEEFRRYEKSEEIKGSFHAITSCIDAEDGLTDQLIRLSKSLFVGDEKLKSLADRINQAQIELSDISAEAADELVGLEMDPLEIENNITLLDAYNSMLKKYSCSSSDQLHEVQKQLLDKLDKAGGAEESLNEWKQAEKQQKKELIYLAKQLSENRKKNVKSIEQTITGILAELKLNSTVFEFSFNDKELTSTGIDALKILFSPNKGHAPQPIEKAASGGELSRLMLAIQYLLSKRKKLPTVIFDEIDTGVSGEVADRIGKLLHKMGETMQLLAITHLPQVASKGESHFKVEKKEKGKLVRTHFLQLNQEERIREIAQLMSGESLNEAAIQNAKELLVK